MPYFFLSYARADGNGYMDRFYVDLCDAVRERTGRRAEEIGFRDRSDIRLGADWRARLTEAVVTARVLIALYSPSYFRSRVCGQEWQLFTDVTTSPPRGPGGPGRPETATTKVLPVLWIPTMRLPEAARRLQHLSEGLGELYEREGLHFLMKIARFQDDYQMFVVRLAERIVAIGEQEPPQMPSVLPDLESVPSAFEHVAVTPQAVDARRGGGEPPGSYGPPTPMEPTPVPSIGPKHVNFVVMATPKDHMKRWRRDLQYYGPSPQDWAPYLPASPDRICVFAQGVASDNDLTSALDTTGRSVLDLLARAEEQNEVVVLLVDVWAMKVDHHRALMIEYDQRNAPTSAVLVPWSHTDDEMDARRDELRNDLRGAFPKNTARDDKVFRPEVRTLVHFRAELEEVLAITQARIFKLGTVVRRAGGDRRVPRPVLGQDD